MAYIIFLLSILSKVACEGTSYMSSETSLWSKSSEICVPATPDIYNVNDSITELSDSEDVWVGYYQVQRVFEYIGCAQFRQLYEVDPRFVSIKGNPRSCFPGCGERTIIGLTKTRCYCLDNIDNVRWSYEIRCTDMCANLSIACGQDMVAVKNTYLSIYKMNLNVSVTSIPFTPTGMGEEKKHCLVLSTIFSKKLFWDGCLRSREVMCYYGSTVVKGLSGYYNWIEAANRCFLAGGFPTLYSNSKDINRNKSELFWTGLFKLDVVYKYNAHIPARIHDQKKFGYIRKESGASVELLFAKDDSMKRVLCIRDSKKQTTQINREIKDESGLSVTVSTTTAVISVIVSALIVVALTVFLMKKRRTNQRSHHTGVGYVPEQPIYITPISEEASGGAYTTIQDNITGGTGEEIGIQNPYNITYESLGERNDSEHGYGASITQSSAYVSLVERHEEEHSYGTTNTQRKAYESLGERHEEEHSYGTQNKPRGTYESLGERHGDEINYGTLEDKRINPHIYEIAEQPRELAYDSLDEETHYDETSNQTTGVKPYEWVE